MYKVGEYVVHPGQGVCEIKKISEGDRPFYMLMPVGQRNPMLISFPVAAQDRLRPVLSRQEAENLIAEYPTMPVEHYKDRSTALEEEHFKREIRNGSCEDTVRIVKTFRKRIADVKARNKKPPVVFERILKKASERSLCEMAVALDTTSDAVAEQFKESVDNAQN
ncbi:MAG: CarD family transcriptional regulator [Coriobacteriaceae bacterium]|jgi:RNA polymerase-interacting CarD/CdnL/TRCF family regulator